MIEEIDFAAGQVVCINKEEGWTSFDVVKKIRNAIKVKKVGHAGTLDPLATGLVIVCTGKATKTIQSIQDLRKTYTGVFRLGYTSASFDRETEIIEKGVEQLPSKAEVLTAFKSFEGLIQQVPPMFSAIKINGKRAYEHARKGQEVELKSREVQIHKMELTDYHEGWCHFKVECSKGTYIRSLARDLGVYFDIGCYMDSLVRTHIGHYSLTEADTVESFVAKHRKEIK